MHTHVFAQGPTGGFGQGKFELRVLAIARPYKKL